MDTDYHFSPLILQGVGDNECVAWDVFRFSSLRAES
jgi:hypothetical protein